MHMFVSLLVCLKSHQYAYCINVSLHCDLCYIEPGDIGENETETINIVVFIGSLIMNWIRV